MDHVIFAQIQDAVADLLKADHNTANHHMKRLAHLLHSDPLNELSSALKADVDFDQWMEKGLATSTNSVGSSYLEVPIEEKSRFGLIISMIDYCAESEHGIKSLSYEFFYAGNDVDQNVRSMTMKLLNPFCRDYIAYAQK